jgi:two-component system sensor histidine kinase PilS (NtrC family)
MEAIAELSASLAHEIKNPLASIRSSVEQLTKPALDAADREVLGDLVLRESDRLSRLLSEFLEFSAMKIVQKEDVDFARVVRNCVDLAQQHPEAGDDTRIESAGLDTEVRIAGDEDLLHRAVFNLILNAVQFAGAGGQVEVELDGRREKDAREHGVAEAPVRFSVRDSGPGIDPKQTSRLFDPFFTTREGGNGMGLAVVHRAVEAHHGAVFVERAPQGGAEFIIYLPRTQDGRS